ncbi:MAG: ATP-grasp domain-containing protein, partial [Gemmatimonadales bacterium]
MTANRVLVLDGHTTQALASVRSLGRAGYVVLVASTRGWPLAGWSRWCAGHFRVASETPAAFADLRDWARRQGVTSVLPMTEPSCLLCTADRSAWEAAGIMLGCGDDEMLSRAFDKAQTLQAALTCDVAIPPTWFPTSAEECRTGAEEVGFPCVVKSRFSHALIGSSFIRGGGASYVARAADLDQAIQAHRQGSYWPIIQAFVGGQGKGVSGLCDRGRIVALFAHERLRDVRPTGSGSSLRRSIRLDARLRAPVERLLTELRWHGPVMVEFRDDGEDALWLMEVNGRFWGSLQLAVSSGVDVPRWLVAM